MSYALRVFSNRTVLPLVVSIIIALCVLGYLVFSGFSWGATTTSTITTNATTTFAKTTIGIGDVRGLFSRLVGEVRSRELKGYDVLYVEYLLLSAKYYYGRGDISRAYELLEKARVELEKAKPLPELPQLNLTIAESTLRVRRVPSVWDFVPLGTVFVLTDRGYLDYPRSDPTWRLSCFIMIAIGRSSGGEWFAYQGRLPLAPREGPFKPRIFINGGWRILDMVFAGPIYYDSGGGRFPYPTVYQYDLSGNILQYIMYMWENRTWRHEIIDLGNNRTLLSITARAIGIPMWLGEWNNTYLAHGVYGKRRGVDLWCGFWDVCIMEAKVSLGESVKKFRGFFIFDRASHRVYKLSKTTSSTPPLHETPTPCRFLGVLGPPLSFSCMVIYQEGLDIMVASSVNPSPWDPGVPLQHQLRVNLLNEDVCIDTTRFHLVDDGGLQPRVFRLWGWFEGGSFNLTGRVICYWPEVWVKGRGTWWNGSVIFTWGRAFIKWTGRVVYNGRIIEVNTIGVGEFTRCKG